MPSATTDHELAHSSAPTPAKPARSLASRLKRWYVVLAIGLLNAVLLLVLINAALWVVLRLRHPPPTPATNFSEHFDYDKLQKAYPGWREDDVKALIRETPRADHEFEYEPFTEFRERPFRGRFVNVDAAGFRLVKNQAPWPPRADAQNIFVFGGSTAFGYYLPDDETIPSYLQEYAAQAGAKPAVAVYNFARPAYFSSQELALFEKLLRDGHVPQVAIFIDGLNDFVLSGGEPKFAGDLREFMNGNTQSNPLLNVPMIRAAYWAKAKTEKQTNATPEEVTPNYADAATLQSVVERWLANKKMIESLAAAYGVRTIFVVQPIPLYKYDLRYHFFLHSDKEFGGFVRAKYGYPLIAELHAQGKLGPDVLWLADMQQDKRENLYVDSVHYNAAFSKEIANRIGEVMQQPR